MSYISLHYHIVFSTKGRCPVLAPEIMPRLAQYLGGIIRELDGHLIAANGPTDHIHLAVILNPKRAIADFVRIIKSNSSRWIHQAIPQMIDFKWQEGYSAFTVSQSGIKQVITYIQNQHKHHKKMTFQEELIAMLKRHNIAFDERYIFTAIP